MEIKLLLEKYKNLGFSQKRIKEITLEVFKQFNLNLESSDVEIKNNEVKILISGTRRTHFVLIKRKIEEKIKEDLKKEGFFISKIY